MKKQQKKADLICWFDGACGPNNPCGAMGIGAYVLDEGEIIFQNHYGVEPKYENSNNVAEYLGLEELCDFLKDYQGKTIMIYGDSNLVVNQMLGYWRIKEGRYMKYALRVKSKFNDLRKSNRVNIKWIPRTENTIADGLSKKGLSMVLGYVPDSDYVVDNEYRPIKSRVDPIKKIIDGVLELQFPNPVGDEVEKVRHLKSLMYKKIKK